MKRGLFAFLLSIAGLAAQAQTYPFVSVTDIQYVSPADLAACNDSSSYLNDTVRTIGIVVTPGALSEVASGSVQGGNRPFIFIADTANGGANTPFSGIEIMGAYRNAQGDLLPLPGIETTIPGDLIEFIGVVRVFNNGTQLEPIHGSSFTILGSEAPPTSTVVNLADLNDANQINLPATGEQWENSFVELQNVTVSSVIYFNGGSRVSFNVVDAFGNTLNVSDRFLVQKLPSHQTVNPYSPQTTGSFVPPVPGTFYSSLKGMLRHDGNGCFTGGGVRGYELNPFDTSHYNVDYAPPYISNFDRDPSVPTSNQSVDLTMSISDFDGTVDTTLVYWTNDTSLSPSAFPVDTLNLVAGTTGDYEYTIPNFPDGTLIRYYIVAIDNEGNRSYYPTTPVGAAEPNFEYYFVRDGGLKVFDIQYSLFGNGDSPLVGQTVTFKGIVTSSTKQYDLGYVFVQDEGGTEWSGIWCVGAGIADVYRDEEVIVTGTVEENFGMTRINVSNIQRTGNLSSIQPIAIDPTDSVLQSDFGWEKYEGVLVEYRLSGSNRLFINHEDLGFGDYSVSDVVGNPAYRSGRILAGRQSSTAQSSLWVQLVTDTAYATLDGEMEVDPIVVADTMSMDAVRGIMYYGFSNYRLLPRNNDDFIGISVQLDSTNLPDSPIGISEWSAPVNVRVYPNPASGEVMLELPENVLYIITLMDLNGRTIKNIEAQGTSVLDLSDLNNGLYFLRATDESGRSGTARIIIQH